MTTKHPTQAMPDEAPTDASAADTETPAADASEAQQPYEAPLPVPERAAFLRSFVYASRGILYALSTQRNMRVHVALSVAAVTLGIVLHLSPIEFALVFVVIIGVFVTEMLNTVTEAVVDLVTREYHPLARIAKDVAAGAVLVNAILAVIVALFIYAPHLWPLALRLLGR